MVPVFVLAGCGEDSEEVLGGIRMCSSCVCVLSSQITGGMRTGMSLETYHPAHCGKEVVTNFKGDNT